MSDPVIRIDHPDAVEVTQILEFVESRLARADPAVTTDFERFVGSDGYPLTELRTDLATWAARLAPAPGEPQ
jgi:hypothetical protein